MSFFEDSAKAIESLRWLDDLCLTVANDLLTISNSGGSVLVAGNGGSFADALHFVGELTCTYSSPKRLPLRAVALGANAAAITAWSNDFGFESFYERQLAAIGKPGDLLVLISTGGGTRGSGYSTNLVKALDKSKEMGIKSIGLVGKNGGVIGAEADLVLHVASHSTAIVQQCHITLIHRICEHLEGFV